jgi:predicted nucleotidyltransferase
MRVSAEQQQIIVDAVHQLFGQQGRVRLFGSRVDDRGKGGDLDLLVELPHLPVDAS